MVAMLLGNQQSGLNVLGNQQFWILVEIFRVPEFVLDMSVTRFVALL